MRIIRNIRIKNDGDYLTTIGLKRLIGFEVRVLMIERDKNQYLELLTYLINYLIDSESLINNGHTIAYHSWILKFVTTNNIFSIYEAKSNGDGFKEGVDYAMKVVAEQKQECNNCNTSALFPLFSQMIVISDGVLEGKDLDAVRYPSPNHMAGWWLTTELYDDDVKSLKTVHYHHLAFNRPDIIKYMALPFGFRFLSGKQTEIWFDEKVLL
ncbi:MAG TPA: hypothetical protein VGN20_04915 [Mucilaginibacter sp.]